MTHNSLLSRLSLFAVLPLLGTTTAFNSSTSSSHGESHRAAAANLVTVVGVEYAFQLPATIPEGLTTFEFRNHGTLLHHLSIARLDSGKTDGDAVEEMTRLGHNLRPAFMTSVGGPAGAVPGQSSRATVYLEPGHYVAYCEIPGPDIARHYMHGMVKAFTVTATSGAKTFPTGDIQLNMVDYAFVLSRPLTTGHHVISVRNGAVHPHMVAIKRFPVGTPPGNASKAIAAWAINPNGKPAPGVGVGGVTEIGPAGLAIVEGDFEPGVYLLICFSAAPNGVQHYKLGMEQEIVLQ